MTLLAVMLPVLILFAAFAIDVGNWFAHKRYLQLKADAGALAAAGKYGGFLPDCQTDLTLAAQIAGVAVQYAGVVSPTPETGVANPVNTEANEPTRLTVFVNSSSYTSYLSDGGTVCEVHADDTRPYSPPDADSDPDGIWTDVKAREYDVPSFFGLFGIPVPQVTAKARVEIRVAQSIDKSLPFAVEGGEWTPCVWARWINDATGAIVGERELFRTDPLGDPFDWATLPSDGLAVTMPAADEHVSMRVRAGDCTDTNRQEIFDTVNPQRGIVFVQSYEPGGSPGPTLPIVRSVRLEPSVAGGCPNAYFSFIKSGTCGVRVRATVDFSANGIEPFVRARVFTNGSPGGWTTLSAGGGEWTGDLGQLTALSGPHGVEISWAQLQGTSSTSCAAAGDPWDAGTPCQDSFGIQQRVFLGSLLRSGPVEVAEIPEGNSFATGSTQILHAHVRMQQLVNDDWNDPGQIIRSSVQTSDNRSGALDCVSGSNFRDEIIDGCTGYQINERTPIPICTPVLSPPDCVTAEPGNKQGQLFQGMNARFGCETNYWRTQGPITAADPRIATLILTNFGAMQRTSGNPQDPVPVLSYAYFYVTGWDGDSCAENDPPPPTSGNTQSSVWGHFIAFTGPPSAGTPSDELCVSFDPAQACIAVLVD